MDLYAENILDHYRHPRHKVAVNEPTVTHEEANMSCGDRIEIFLKLNDEKISEIGWTGEGCAISQAAMSLLSEEVIEKSIKDIESMDPTHIHELLGVPIGPRRTKCALLCLHTLKNALRKSHGELPQSWTETVGAT